jgi:hypothetical protein
MTESTRRNTGAHDLGWQIVILISLVYRSMPEMIGATECTSPRF